MKEIQLTQGKTARVDDDIYEHLIQWKWFANKRRGAWYAVRNEHNSRPAKTVYMHRQITNSPPEMDVDHIDGDGLNNTKENLRICTTSQNIINSRKQLNRSTKFKGVTFDKQTNKFKAQIGVNQKNIHLGRFDSQEEAARTYDDAARKYFGDFAKTNF